MSATLMIEIDQIRVSEKQRRKVCWKKVEAHRRDIEAGDDPLPIDVRQLDDGSYVIAGNGRHRYFAYLAAGFSVIPARFTAWLRKLGQSLKRLLGRLLD